MKDNDYLLPAVAALILACLFPAYWLIEIISHWSSMEAALWSNMTSFGLVDVLFLFIGMLCVYIYLSIRTLLVDRFNYQGLNVILYIMVAANILFFAGVLGLDLLASILNDSVVLRHKDTLLGMGIFLTFGGLALFGLLDIIIGIFLLRCPVELPNLLKAFAIITLVQGILGLTVLLYFAVILIYPISLIVLSIYLLSKPETIEVV
jgi:hypothetical protein